MVRSKGSRLRFLCDRNRPTHAWYVWNPKASPGRRVLEAGFVFEDGDTTWKHEGPFHRDAEMLRDGPGVGGWARGKLRLASGFLELMQEGDARCCNYDHHDALHLLLHGSLCVG